jgi:hypothetical protein
MKEPGARTSTSVCVKLSLEEIEAFNAFCAAKGWSRTYVIRRYIRKAVPPEGLSEAASLFRRLQKALPELEAP